MRYNVREEYAYINADARLDKGCIEIGEDEFILDSEYRGSNRIVVAIASPIEEQQKACGVCGCAEPCDHGCCGVKA